MQPIDAGDLVHIYRVTTKNRTKTNCHKTVKNGHKRVILQKLFYIIGIQLPLTENRTYFPLTENYLLFWHWDAKGA